MKFIYNNKEYLIDIIKKNNKNTYIRVSNDRIIVTTNYFATKLYIKRLIKDNYKSITKMLDKEIEKRKQREKFFIFGTEYNIIYDDSYKKIEIKENNIYVKNDTMLNNYINNYIKEVFTKHLEKNYNLFEEDIPKPTLRLRSMKTRWGVCNTKTHIITLNKELIRYNIKCLDYVCIHELSHLIEGNHSKKFWNIVSKYCPNYKDIKKILK